MLLDTISFRNIGNNEFPDLKDYSFIFNLSVIDTTVMIIEDFGTGKLWVKIDDMYLVPFRINTNLLPSTLSYKYALVYDYYKQCFLFYDK